MARKSTPFFVVELPLNTAPADPRRLNGVLDAGKRLNNVMLQEGRAIVQAIRDDPAWDLARKLPKPRKSALDAAAVNQARRNAFGAVRKVHGFTEAVFHARMQVCRNASGLGDRIGSDLSQKIASKVYSALEQHLVGARGLPRFKGIKRP